MNVKNNLITFCKKLGETEMAKYLFAQYKEKLSEKEITFTKNIIYPIEITEGGNI